MSIELSDLERMQIGDQIEDEPLFPALTHEPVKLRLLEIEKRKWVFGVSWLGVVIGRWTAIHLHGGTNIDWMYK